MKKKSTFILFSLFCFLTVTAVSESISFKADGMTGKAGSKSDTTSLTGNAFVKTETMEISADSITLSGDDFRYITAEGTVSAKNIKTDMDFTCEKLSYDRETKIAVLDTNVHFKDIKNEVTAEAQMVEYNQDLETAILQINIKLVQKDNVCTGAYAIYHIHEQTLEISGSPKITQGDDIFRAQEITLNLDSQEITLSGRVQGTVTSSKKTESEKSDETIGENPENNNSDTINSPADKQDANERPAEDAKQENESDEKSLSSEGELNAKN